MCESVKTFALFLDMPVVKEIVVEQSASYKAVFVNVDIEGMLEKMCNEKTELRYCYAVVEYTGLTVLCKLLHLLRFGTENNALSAGKQFLRKSVFSDLFLVT